MGPNTLKNLQPTHCGGSGAAVARALDHREIEQVLAPAVEIHRLEPRQRLKRIVVGEAALAVAVGRGRGGVDQRHARLGAPVEKHQREAEIGVDDEVAVGRGGLRDRAKVKHGIELAAREPAREIGRGDEIGQAALLQVPPLALGAEKVADGDIAMPGLVQRRHQVRSDEAGPAGDQEHAQRAPLGRPSGRPLLCPSRPGTATPAPGVDGDAASGL